MPVLVAAQVYAEQLSKKGLGYPLWYPEPDHTRGQIRIGDVGYIDSSGDFHAWFNVTDKPRDEDDEMSNYPPDFYPLQIDKRLEHFRSNCIPGGVLPIGSISAKMCSPRFTVGPSDTASASLTYTYKSNKQKAALFGSAYDSHKSLVANNRDVKEYIKHNHERWYEYGSQNLGLTDVKREDIILVQGFIKNPQFLVMSFSSESSDHNVAVQGSFSEMEGCGFSFDRQETIVNAPDHRSGPPSFVPPQTEKVLDQMPELWDQTVFLARWRVKWRIPNVYMHIRGEAGPHQLPDYNNTPDSSSAMYLASSMEGMDIDIESEMEPPTDPTPLDILLDYLMSRVPDADYAIESDYSVEQLMPSDIATGEQFSEALMRENPTVEVEEDEDGKRVVSLSMEYMIKRDFYARVKEKVAEARPMPQPEEGPSTGHGRVALPRYKFLVDHIDHNHVAKGSLSFRYGPSQEHREIEWPQWALRDLNANTGRQTAMAISPTNPNILATGGENGSVKIWYTRTGKLIFNSPVYNDIVLGMSFSPDGKKLVTSSRGNTVTLWNLDNLESISSIQSFNTQTQHIASVLFSPDSTRFLAGSREGSIKQWKQWSEENLGELGEFENTDPPHLRSTVISMKFSPDASTLVTISESVAKIWGGHNNTEHLRSVQHSDIINTIDISPDGEYIITSSDDSTAKVWSVRDGAERHTFDRQGGPVYVAVFAPPECGTKVAIGSHDSKIHIIDYISGEYLHSMSLAQGAICRLAWSKDGKYLVSGNLYKGDIYLWNAENGLQIAKLSGHRSGIVDIGFSADDKTILSLGRNSEARVWELGAILSLAL